LKDVSADWS